MRIGFLHGDPGYLSEELFFGVRLEQLEAGLVRIGYLHVPQPAEDLFGVILEMGGEILGSPDPQRFEVCFQRRCVHLQQRDRGSVEKNAIPRLGLPQGVLRASSLGDVTKDDKNNRPSVDLDQLAEGLEEKGLPVGTLCKDFL